MLRKTKFNFAIFYSRPHVITDHLSDGVTLAVADSTTPAVDIDFVKRYRSSHNVILHCMFIKVVSSLKRRGKLSETRKLKQKS